MPTLRKFRDPAEALRACRLRPDTTILAGQDSEGTYWAIGRASGLSRARWALLMEDGRMVIWDDAKYGVR